MVGPQSNRGRAKKTQRAGGIPPAMLASSCVLGLILAAAPGLATAALLQQHPGAPHVAAPRPPAAHNEHAAAAPTPAQPNNQVRGEHLGPWLQQHQSMTPQAQEQALRREPGFNKLPAETQQRLVTRLQQLNSLPPEQRQRTLARMEAMESLSPAQKQEVRNSAQTLGAMPQDRQRLVRKAFRDLRDVPVDQRQSVLSSAKFQSMFSPQERDVLSNLLTVEPYEPSGKQ